jgi:hypothetical protein
LDGFDFAMELGGGFYMFERGYDKFFCEYLKAGDPDATPEELAVLARHRDYRIRRRVAENPSTPPELFDELSKDQDPDVRIAVGINPAADTFLKLRLACDHNATVRLGLAHEPGTPEIVLHQLEHDENAWVAAEAKRALEILAANRNGSGVADFARYHDRHEGQGQRAS